MYGHAPSFMRISMYVLSSVPIELELMIPALAGWVANAKGGISAVYQVKERRASRNRKWGNASITNIISALICQDANYVMWVGVSYL